jgi:hypothetical protein
MSAHEDPPRQKAEQTETAAAPSDRQFALVFTIGWSLIGLAPLLRGRPARWWAVGLAAAVGLLWVVRPRWLTPLNRAWMALGALLGRITTPLVTGALFFVGVTPLAWLYRLLGKDPLARRFDREAATYWIERRPPGPPGDSMRRQF